MTRETDVRVNKQMRGLLASEVPNSVLVSLHFNREHSRSVRGLETYAMTPMGVKSSNDSRATVEAGFGFQGNLRDDASLALAAAVHSQIIHRTGCEDRGVRRARFAVLKDSERAGILIEAGYLSHPEEGALINEPEYRNPAGHRDRRGRSPLSPGHRRRALRACGNTHARGAHEYFNRLQTLRRVALPLFSARSAWSFVPPSIQPFRAATPCSCSREPRSWRRASRRPRRGS